MLSLQARETLKCIAYTAAHAGRFDVTISRGKIQDSLRRFYALDRSVSSIARYEKELKIEEFIKVVPRRKKLPYGQWRQRASRFKILPKAIGLFAYLFKGLLAIARNFRVSSVRHLPNSLRSGFQEKISSKVKKRKKRDLYVDFNGTKVPLDDLLDRDYNEVLKEYRPSN